jgi:hypothetical protein
MRFNVELGLVMTALLFSGCRNMPPIGSLFDMSPEAIGTGITGVGVVRAFVIVAKYQATERQRQVAEQNARRAYQKIVALQETVPSVIFVDTSREKRSKGSKSVMIARFPKKRPSPSPSTRVEPQPIISGPVYDLGESPSIMEKGTIENVEGQYVDGGLTLH